MFDPYNERVWVQSHQPPYSTVIDAKEGTVVGTLDLGGQPEQAVSDRKGHLYIDLEDKGSIAVVDAKALKVTGTYDLAGKGGTCAGLAFDVKNHVLFATCRNPQTMVILNSENGSIITTLPIGSGTDGAVFNPSTMETFSSQSDGTLTVVKENSPTSFVVEQTVKTMPVRPGHRHGQQALPAATCCRAHLYFSWLATNRQPAWNCLDRTNDVVRRSRTCSACSPFRSSRPTSTMAHRRRSLSQMKQSSLWLRQGTKRLR
jgi:hypothetical protein